MPTIEPRKISLKMFAALFDLRNHYAARDLYDEYLQRIGKSPGMHLTNIDLFKLDSIILK